VSYVHYHGKTKSSYAGAVHTLLYHNDTVCVLPAGTVDSMVALPPIVNDHHYAELYGLFLSSGDTVVLAGQEMFMCGMPLLFGFNPDGGEPDWQKLGLTRFSVSRQNSQNGWMIGAKPAYLSTLNLRRMVGNKETIVLTTYGPAVAQFLKGLDNFKLDHSIGISTYSYPKKESK